MGESTERNVDAALLDGRPDVSPLQEAPPPSESDANEEIRRLQVVSNFMTMAVSFSANHGTVTALIALASTSLGSSLGNISNGILYLTYTSTAAFGASGLTSWLGAKRTLIVGLAIYCVYVASYLVAYIFPAAKGVVYVGAIFGGVAAGTIWPAQGIYFARCAELYADRVGVTREVANSRLGGYFASTYLAFEVALKLASSLLPSLVDRRDGTLVLFAVFTALAIAAVFGVATIDPFDTKKPSSSSRRVQDCGKSTTAALGLLASSDGLCACLIPFNFAFGFGSSYVNGHFYSAVVAANIGKYAVGYVAAILVFSASLFSLAYGKVGQRSGGQAPVVAVGAVCFASFAAVNLYVPVNSLGHWPTVACLAVLFGSARSTWEGAFKATVADFFPDDAPAAFANVQLQSGIASTIGFFLNSSSSISSDVVGFVAAASAVLALPTQLCARSIDARRRQVLEPYTQAEASVI